MNDLHELLHDAVAGVEPTDRLDDLRARTAGPARAAARPWFYAAGAAVLATAAAVTVVAVVGDGPADPPTAGHDEHHDPAAERLVPAYFSLGDLLYREYDTVPEGRDRLDRALERIQQPPDDPDYTTGWRAGTLVDATEDDDTIDVEVARGQELRTDTLATQQVVLTLQGTIGERLPVRFVRNGTVLLGPLTANLDVLSPVSISDPTEGHEYSGSFVARGRADTYAGPVTWAVKDRFGKVRTSGTALAAGTGTGLRAWEVTVDVTGLAPDTYTFVLQQELGPGVGSTGADLTDTRTITVR